ncbi:MAG TPA: N-acetyltransferase [Acidiferrobacteraceae bacterium]|nr:N-acetyltransferase [Acidiferrobacteraceae bacterium]
MRLETIDRLSTLPPSQWNRLCGTDYPFARHEFLNALEDSDCVCAHHGWIPQHLVAYQKDSTGDRDANTLIGAVPLYLKDHSYGEYVFDWAWADAYARSGLNYYPKLVAAIPFTPATGPRLLTGKDDPDQTIKSALVKGVQTYAEDSRVSSLHWLFTQQSTHQYLAQQGLLTRIGHQFHWHNPGYEDFDQFLNAFCARKRKKIKRERRRVEEAGIHVDMRTGSELDERHWDAFYAFYLGTIQRHSAIPYLSRRFFHTLGRSMPEYIVMAVAYEGPKLVAMALNLSGQDTLYGRYWGSLRDYHSLHFETCYYAAIEYCIKQQLKRFEAGAQGEHKLSRGFLATTTYSAHWLRHPEFATAIADFLQQEDHGMRDYIKALDQRTPYRKAQ